MRCAAVVATPSRRVAIAALLAATALGCEPADDYARVIVRGTDTALTVSPLDLRVVVSGGGASRTYPYTAQPKRAAAGDTQDLSDFTLTFGAGAGALADVRVLTRPSGEAVDWGGDARIRLPAGGGTAVVSLSRGESELQTVDPKDGDLDSAAAYGGQLVLAWPTVSRRVSILSINPDRPQGLERPPELGVAPSKVRVASRPSADFTSEIFAATWIESSAQPTLKTESRTQVFDARRIGAVERASDVRVACARRGLFPAIVTAVLIDGRVLVHAHDEAGQTVAGPFSAPELERVNRLVGLVVTPDDTVTLAVNGNGSRLVQLNMKTGAVVHVQSLAATAVAMSPNADGARLLVASIDGVGDAAKLQLESYSVVRPTRTQEGARVLGRFAYVPGVALSRVSLASCAVAWPEPRPDGVGATDVLFQELDGDGLPAGEPHLANVSVDGHHYAPTVVCLSPTRAFVTMLSADSKAASIAKLTLRRLPTSRR